MQRAVWHPQRVLFSPSSLSLAKKEFAVNCFRKIEDLQNKLRAKIYAENGKGSDKRGAVFYLKTTAG